MLATESRSEEHTSELQSRRYLHSFPTRRSSDRGERVVPTAERIVPTAEFVRCPELTVVPAFLVDAVVEAPGGAWPGSCHPCYGVDEAAVRDYLAHAGDRE